jgi:hypothetical protein
MSARESSTGSTGTASASLASVVFFDLLESRLWPASGPGRRAGQRRGGYYGAPISWALVTCPRPVAEDRCQHSHSLAVDHIGSEIVFIVYFGAPHRVDFRALVRDLGGRLRFRVELRQIGRRDEARLQGRIGPARQGRSGACGGCASS